jgi:hypothetical protein
MLTVLWAQADADVIPGLTLSATKRKNDLLDEAADKRPKVSSRDLSLSLSLSDRSHTLTSVRTQVLGPRPPALLIP